jgi:hypothetical protein
MVAVEQPCLNEGYPKEDRVTNGDDNHDRSHLPNVTFTSYGAMTNHHAKDV